MMRSGEPHRVELAMWEGDQAFHGQEMVSCCHCGLDHFNLYEMFVVDRRVVLQIRSHRMGKRGKYYG